MRFTRVSQYACEFLNLPPLNLKSIISFANNLQSVHSGQFWTTNDQLDKYYGDSAASSSKVK